MFGRTFNPLSLKDVTGLSRNNCRKPRPGTWLQRAKKAAGCLRRSHSSHAGSPCMVATLMMDDISRESLLPEPPQRSLSENLPNLTCAVRLSRKKSLRLRRGSLDVPCLSVRTIRLSVYHTVKNAPSPWTKTLQRHDVMQLINM